MEHNEISIIIQSSNEQKAPNGKQNQKQDREKKNEKNIVTSHHVERKFDFDTFLKYLWTHSMEFLYSVLYKCNKLTWNEATNQTRPDPGQTSINATTGNK